MELQDRVTVVLTKHGANVLNNQNKEYNDKFPKAERRRTDYDVGMFLSDSLFNIINTFRIILILEVAFVSRISFQR